MEGGNGVEQGEGGDGVEQGGGWRRSGAGLRATTERRRRGGPRSGPGRRSGVVARSPAERSRHPEALRSEISARKPAQVERTLLRKPRTILKNLDNPQRSWRRLDNLLRTQDPQRIGVSVRIQSW